MKQENKQRKAIFEKLQELCFPVSNKLVRFDLVYFWKSSMMRVLCEVASCLSGFTLYTGLC